MNQIEAFEAWYKTQRLGNEDWFQRDMEDPEEYYRLDTRSAWIAWQAALAAQWQPIETAPKVELKDLIVFNGEVQHGQWWEGYWINSLQEYMEPRPTMWHELPPEPTK